VLNLIKVGIKINDSRRYINYCELPYFITENAKEYYPTTAKHIQASVDINLSIKFVGK